MISLGDVLSQYSLLGVAAFILILGSIASRLRDFL